MSNNEYWKQIYKNKWIEGKKRADYLKSMLEAWNFKVEPFGFMPSSTAYSKDNPDEPGKPDWKVILPGKEILLEVTGTKNSRDNFDVWIRNDKFLYAENHREYECWLGHVVDRNRLVRFFKIENRAFYPYREMLIDGIEERYRVIDELSSRLLYSDEFRLYLKGMYSLELKRVIQKAKEFRNNLILHKGRPHDKAWIEKIKLGMMKSKC